MTALMLLGGLAVLTLGAEVLVRSASAIAIAAKVSPLVVGLTVVAFGTSAPEFVVSLQASLRGQADIALGNVVGSNILNVLLILGLSALIIPLKVAQQLVRFDVPLMIALSVVMAGMAWDGSISRWDGLILMTGLLAYVVFGIVQSRREQADILQEYAAEFDRPATATRSKWTLLINLALLVGGLALLVVGSRWFTDAAITIARQAGVSELVIGLTIVAAGTSLPEVATSVMAAIRGERDIAVGNVVGSNLFNIMGVLGFASAVSADGIAVSNTALAFDIPVMVAVAVSCLPIFFTGHLIARWEGGLFLGYYIVYSAYLVLAETQPGVTRTFGVVMQWFILPLTAVTLLIGVYRAFGTQSSGSDSQQ